MRLSSILLLLFFVAGCASPLTPMQMEQYQKNIERAQQMQYASWLEQNKGKPVNTGYFRLQNYTQQTFIISLIHPDTQKEYHRITLPPTSEGWFPARDNKNKLIIGNDWGLRTTYLSGGSALIVLSDQIGCTYASGKAYQNHYGVDQNFYTCKYGVSDARLTKYALLPAATVNSAGQVATSDPTALLRSLSGITQQSASAPSSSQATSNSGSVVIAQTAKQSAISDNEVIIHEDFDNKNSEFAFVGTNSHNRYSGRKGEVKKGKNYIEFWGQVNHKIIFTDKKHVNWNKYNYPLDLTRDFEYQVTFDLSKSKDLRGRYRNFCQVLGASDNHKQYIRFCMVETKDDLKSSFAGESLSKKIPFSNEKSYTLTTKKIDGLFHLYINGLLIEKFRLPDHKKLSGPNFGITLYDNNGNKVAIDSFTLSYLNNNQSRFANWKFDKEAGNQTGNLLISNHTAYKKTYELWEPATKNKYNYWHIKPDTSVYLKDSSRKYVKVSGNWGIKQKGFADSNIEAIHSVAKWNGSIWYLSKGSSAESNKRKQEKIAAQKRLEATPEYKAEQQRKKMAACKSDLKYQQQSLDELIVKMGKPICEDDVEIYFSPTTYRDGHFYESFKKDCIGKDVKWLKDSYLKPIKNKISKITNTCNAVGIDVSAIQTNTRLALSSLESSYDQRVNQIASDLKRIDENARNKRAAEKRAHEAQMEANFQEWAGRMRGQDYSSFLDSIGHDSSSRGVTAKAQQVMRDYAKAQQKQGEMQQDYTKILAQIDAKTAAIKVPKAEPKAKTLTPQEKCARDKQKDSRLYWDTRSNKCMLKMYENTEINMKDIGVATTGNNATSSTRSAANNQTTSRTTTGANSTTNNSATSISSVSGNLGKSQDSDASSSTSNQVPPSATFKARSVVTGEPISREGTPGPWGKVFHVSNKEFGVEPWWPVSGFKGLKARASCADDDYGSVYTNYWLRNTTNDTVYVRGAFKLVDTHNNEKQTFITYDVKPGEDKHISGSYMKGRCQFDNLQIFVRAEEVRYRKDKGKAIDAT